MACVADLSSRVPFTRLIGLRDAFVVLFTQLISEKRKKNIMLLGSLLFCRPVYQANHIHKRGNNPKPDKEWRQNWLT